MLKDMELSKWISNHGYLFALLGILIYLFIGTIFYNYYDGFGWAGGFNYAVSIAFTIGWNTGYYETKDLSYLFSTFYICGGVLLASIELMYISHYFSINREKWYIIRRKKKEFLKRIAIEENNNNIKSTYRTLKSKFRILYHDNTFYIVSFFVFIMYIILGVVICSFTEQLDFISCLYFVISTISTTGSYVPAVGGDASLFTVFSLYAIGGIFTGSIAIVYLLQNSTSSLLYERVSHELNNQPNLEEMRTLIQMQVCNNETNITKQEYLIMIATRLNLIDDTFIKIVFDHYNKLNNNSIYDSSDDNIETSLVKKNSIQNALHEPNEETTLI